MSNLHQIHIPVEEDTPLYTVPGSSDSPNDDTEISGTACWCNRRHHRTLAIWSIICGISCIGITALIASVRAEQETNPKAAMGLSRRVKKWSIISITVWICILVLTPILMILISYLVTLID